MSVRVMSADSAAAAARVCPSATHSAARSSGRRTSTLTTDTPACGDTSAVWWLSAVHRQVGVSGVGAGAGIVWMLSGYWLTLCVCLFVCLFV